MNVFIAEDMSVDISTSVYCEIYLYAYMAVDLSMCRLIYRRMGSAKLRRKSLLTCNRKVASSSPGSS